MIVGEIASRARSELPSTWDALSRATMLYGEGYLQTAIDDVKWRLFQRTVNVSEEASMDRTVLRYAGKMTALSIIPGAIDYWNDQPIGEVSTGTSEQETYPDRPKNLFEVYARLQKELTAGQSAIDVILGPQAVRRILTPVMDSQDVDLVTPDPWLWPGQTAGSEGTAATQ